MALKKRTLNELRQEKEFGYKEPSREKLNSKKDLQTIYSDIKSLVIKYPNDCELGKNFRRYLIDLGLYE